MSEDTHGEDVGEMEIELPPALDQFLAIIRGEQKHLLKEKAFANGDQLRKFLALTVMERLAQSIEMLGTTMYDLHSLGVSNARQLQIQREWTAKHLRKLGAEVSDGEPFGGQGTEKIDALGQALYGLGTYLQSKHGGDKEMEARFNGVMHAFNQLVESLMGDQSAEDEDEDEGAGEPGDESAAGDEAEETGAEDVGDDS